MRRREVLKAIALFPLLIQPMFAGKFAYRRKRTIKPKRLKLGDTIGIISPAGKISKDSFDEALENLNGLGFKTKVGKFARGDIGYLSGTDEERLHDLHWAFSDSEIDAIWCMRGGYGTPRLLPTINYKLIKKNPKILIGYSDITALILSIYQKTGLITFHGPVAASDFTEYTKQKAFDVLMNPRDTYVINLPNTPAGADSDLYKSTVIREGKCRGKMVGGNLSLLAALAGTSYELKKTKGRILFIEDINEPPYKVDRLLTQMRQSIDMHKFEGIAIGVFTNGDSKDAIRYTGRLNEIYKDRLGGLGIPIISGLSFGHIKDNFTIPIGIKAEMNTEDSTIKLLESAVT